MTRALRWAIALLACLLLTLIGVGAALAAIVVFSYFGTELEGSQQFAVGVLWLYSGALLGLVGLIIGGLVALKPLKWAMHAPYQPEARR